STMTRCKGREQPEGLTFALRRNGRTRSFLNRYCGSWTSISPNFVCQRTFSTLAMHLRLLTNFPLRHLRLPLLRPAQQRFASQTPRLLDQPLFRSVRLLQIAFAILYRQGYRRDTVSNVRMAAQKGKQPFIAQIRARHQLRPPKSPPTKLTPHRVESHPTSLCRLAGSKGLRHD